MAIIDKLGRAPFWLGESLEEGAKLGGRVVGGSAKFAARHPKLLIGTAIAAGAASSALKAATSPEVQEAITGYPDTIGHVMRSIPEAVLTQNYNPRDYNNPYWGSTRRGQVIGTPNYVFGQPVQGGILGDIAGSRMFGGYNLGGNTINGRPSALNRIRGRGDAPIADGSMVFGMWNLRR